eukprot:TRINITY_DN379_c0_g1_i1.p1 TRINITY_DN379_c0_g1~~TRINITY_DN379_c0_g1_i1.p1  ORF type:complete len:468 (+),score=136.27 TRINITY_DN379_c0_g1_i1:49-1452(+)
MVLVETLSGIRGDAGIGLTPIIVAKYITVFNHIVEEGPIVVGHDARITHPWVVDIVIATLRSHGRKVYYLDVAATPTVQYMVLKLNCSAGIVVTSSHNPIQYNGLKFVDKDGMFFRPDKANSMIKTVHSDTVYDLKNTEINLLGDLERYTTANTDHIKAILDLPYMNVETIRSKRYKVALDTTWGAGGPIMEELLTELNCEVFPINTQPTGQFTHNPEPTPVNLQELCACVKKNHCDIGIATDPDVDRCVLVNEDGECLSEEYTLALAVNFLINIQNRKGSVYKNLSTSNLINYLCQQYGCECYETAVGEINVGDRMEKDSSCIIGGEGNGGVMLPDVHIGRDAPVAASLALATIAGSNQSLKDVLKSFPKINMKKDKMEYTLPNMKQLYTDFKNEFLTIYPNASIIDADGIKAIVDDWWVHVRGSNTEPIIRVIAENLGDNDRTDEIIAESFNIIKNVTVSDTELS